MIPAALLLINSFFLFVKLIILIACFLKDSQDKTFSHNLYLLFSIPLYLLYIYLLFSMPLNEDILGIGKPDGICLLISVAD